MPRLDDYKVDNRSEKIKIGIMIAVVSILLIAILAGVLYILRLKSADHFQSNVTTEENLIVSETQQAELEYKDSAVESEDISLEENVQDPQSELNQDHTESGAIADISNILIAEGAEEIELEAIGIDVSKYQGNIDWKAVADAGVDFAMIRVGYRTMESGGIVEDDSARYNLQ